MTRKDNNSESRQCRYCQDQGELSYKGIATFYLLSSYGTMITLLIGLGIVIGGKACHWSEWWWGLIVMIFGAMIPIGVGHFKPYIFPAMLILKLVGLRISCRSCHPERFLVPSTAKK